MTNGQKRGKTSKKAHFRLFLAITVTLVVVLSAFLYEVVTMPASQVPYGKMQSVDFRSLGYSFNSSVVSHTFNESGFAATFDMNAVPPEKNIMLGTTSYAFLAISVFNVSVKSPFQGMAFEVQSATLTIGNYTTSSYSAVRNNISLMIEFRINGDLIMMNNSYDHHYTGFYSVTLIPSETLSVFHLKQQAITLKTYTGYSWFYIPPEPVT